MKFLNKCIDYSIVFFFIAIVSIPALFFVSDEKDLSYILRYEKRYPEKMPEWNNKPTFIKQFERYFEGRLWGRKYFLVGLAKAKYAIKTSMNPERVLIGQNNWLFLANRDFILRHRNLMSLNDSEGTTNELFCEEMFMLQKWCKRQGTTLLLSIPPRKHDIYPEFLPKWANVKAQKPNAMENFISQLNTSGVNFVDLRNVLTAAKELGQLYYPLDTHWSGLGAFIAYQAITEKAYQLQQIQWSPLDFRIAKKTVGGNSLALMIYLEDLKQFGFEIETINPLDKYDLYRENELIIKSTLRGIRNQDVPVEARNPNEPNAPTAIWLRDSFGIAATPFLMQYFSKVYVYDYRTGGAFNKSPLRIDTLVRKHNPDILLIAANEARFYGELSSMLKVTLLNLTE